MLLHQVPFLIIAAMSFGLVEAVGADRKAKFVPQHPSDAYFHKSIETFRGEVAQVTTPCELADPKEPLYGLSTGKFGTCIKGQKDRMSEVNQIIAPEWGAIVVTTSQVYVKRRWDDKTYLRIPVEKTKQGWKAGAPVPTPYVKIARAFKAGNFPAQDPVFLGIWPDAEDKTLIVDLIDRDGRATVTLSRLTNDFETGVTQLSETTLATYVLDDVGNKVLGLMDRDGRFLAPPLPNVKQFQPASIFIKPPYYIFAVPLDDKGERYLPLQPDGTVRIEPKPVKAYHVIQPKPFSISAWIKEYDDNGASLWGWASPDLATETGPIWRSIKLRAVGVTTPHYLVQHLDGTWMAYHPQIVKAEKGYEVMSPEPLLKKPMATAEEITGIIIIKAWGDRQLEELKKPEHNRYVSQGYRWYLTGSDLKAGSEQEKIQSDLMDKAIAARDWSTAESYAANLGGDHWVLFHVSEASATNKIVGHSTFWNQLAAQAKTDRLRTAARDIAKKQEEKEAAEREAFRRQLVWEQDQANLRASQATAGLKAWLLSGGGMTMPSAAKPSYAEQSAATLRYMTEFDNYQRGRQDWKPAAPSHMMK